MRTALFFLGILLLSNVPSLYYSLYIHWWWLDAVQHFLGGFFVAMFFRDYLKGHFIHSKKINNALIIVGSTIFIGVVWEFVEYIGNQTLVEPFYRWFEIRAYFMGDLKDTVSDLALDITGALVLYILLGAETPINSRQDRNTTETDSDR